MATLKVSYDITNKKFTTSELLTGTVYNEMGDVNYNDLYIVFGFTDGNKNPIEFNNLNFSVNAYKENELIRYHSFPTNGNEYMRSSIEYIEHCKIDVQPGSQYNIHIAVSENYNESNIDIALEIPSYSDYELDYVNSHPEQPNYELFISENSK